MNMLSTYYVLYINYYLLRNNDAQVKYVLHNVPKPDDINLTPHNKKCGWHKMPPHA